MAEKIDGFNDLALTIQQRIGAVSASPLVLDFGVINGDGSLRTNSYPVDVPLGDYLVCDSLLEHLCICDPTVVDPHPDGVHAEHIHGVRVKKRFIPGIRVLVAWVGHDAVVIDIIRVAKEV